MPTFVPRNFDGRFDSFNINTVTYPQEVFPTRRNLPTKKGKKMAKATFKVVVKDGDQKYDLNPKTGAYDYKTVDYVYEASSLGDALREFLDYVNDDFNEDKVSLTFVPAKKNKK